MTIFQIDAISMLDSKEEGIEEETQEVLSRAWGTGVAKWQRLLRKSLLCSKPLNRKRWKLFLWQEYSRNRIELQYVLGLEQK